MRVAAAGAEEGRGSRARGLGGTPPSPPPPGLGSSDTRPGARSPRLGPGGDGRAGGGALRCAGRRERGGEDSSGSGGQRDGGRTCGLGGRLTVREERQLGLHGWAAKRRWGSPGLRSPTPSPAADTAQRAAHRPHRLSCAQVGTPARSALFPSRANAGRTPWRPGHQARGRGPGRSGGSGKVHGPLVCPPVRARCAGWGRGAEKPPPWRFCPAGLPVPTPTPSSRAEPWSGFGGLRPPPPHFGGACWSLLFPVYTQEPSGGPLLGGPRDCRNLGKRESGGRTSRGVCGEGRSCWSIVCRAGA